jgi:hypothetical protein
LGQIIVTSKTLHRLSQKDILVALQRHQAGDWGEIFLPYRHANDQALRDGTKLVSSYYSSFGVEFWLITEADRSATTVLLPEDY